MAKKQKTYLLVCLLISSVLLFVVNFYANLPISKYIGYLKITSGLLLPITLVVAFIYLLKRTRTIFKISTLIALTFLIVNLVLVQKVISFEIQKAELDKIKVQMATCERAIRQFDLDLKDDDLKYFTFGLGDDADLRRCLEKNII